MQYIGKDGRSLIVERTGDAEYPVIIEVQSATGEWSANIMALDGDLAKQVAEQLIDIWGDDLDNSRADTD